MATPQPLSAVVEENGMELEGLWRKALADGVVTHAEAARIYQYEQTHLAKPLTDMTTSWAVIESIVRGGQGIHSYRVVRTLRELWARPANVVRLRIADGPEAA